MRDLLSARILIVDGERAPGFYHLFRPDLTLLALTSVRSHKQAWSQHLRRQRTG